MIAEIYGKTNNTLEDELTGNFFGNLRYIPFEKGLKPFLVNCVFPSGLSEISNGIDTESWPDNISFWPREKEAEPDILIECGGVTIIIEVKFLSGLSSDDDVDNSGKLEQEISCNQLQRERRLLERIAPYKTKVLLLLAPESSAHKIYSDVVKRNLTVGVLFGYITWQKALTVLTELDGLNRFEQVVINDLTDLLKKKGFERFESFNKTQKPVNPSLIWTFDYDAEYISQKLVNPFSFDIPINVKRGLFYEFG